MLKSAVFWTLSGNIISAACQWGYLLLLSNFSTAANLGYYALAQAVIYPIFSFLNLQLRRQQVTEQNTITSFYSFRYYAIVSGILSSLVSIIIGSSIGDGSADFTLVLLAFSAVKFIESVSDVNYGMLQKNDNMKKPAISLMLRSVSAYLLFSLFVFLGFPLWSAVFGVSIASVVVLYFYDNPSVSPYLDISINKQHRSNDVKRIIHYGLPLGFLLLLNQLNLNVPRYFLNALNGLESVGHFAAIASLLSIGSVFMNSIGQAFLPHLSRCFSQKRIVRIRFLLLFMLVISGGGGCIGMLVSSFFGAEFLVGIYGPNYVGQEIVFFWIMATGTALYMSGMLGTVLTAARRVVSQAGLTVLVVAVTTVSCFLLVPEHGTIGAAKSLFYGSLVKLFVQAVQIIFLLFGESFLNNKRLLIN